MKMAWGKTQEASALHCLLQLFPHSLLEEVGSVGCVVGGECVCVGGGGAALVATEAEPEGIHSD